MNNFLDDHINIDFDEETKDKFINMLHNRMNIAQISGVIFDDPKNLWIKKPDYTYLGITTHTVECPVCKNRQTYNGDTPPEKCYLCDCINYKEG